MEEHEIIRVEGIKMRGRLREKKIILKKKQKIDINKEE